MKSVVLAPALLMLASAADAQRNRRNDTEAVERACTVTDCFQERDIRHFEVIDRTHVIVYTGPQRCAFHVEVRGTFCDLTFAPDLYFSSTNELRDNLISRPRDPLGRTPAMDPLDQLEPNRRNLKICANDLTIQVHGGPFTESVGQAGPMVTPNPRVSSPTTDCRVSGVTAITDDQLLEFFVGRGVLAPPPPMGAAEIEVGEQSPEAASPEGSVGSRGRRSED
jgi:hypothetical protein